MGSRLISTNGKGLEDYISKLKKMQKDAVTVGIHKSAGNHDNSDLTVAEVAAYNEFGTERSPERSFMRSTMRENRLKYRLNVIRIVKAIGDGKSPRKMMGLFGHVAATKVVNSVIIHKKIVLSQFRCLVLLMLLLLILHSNIPWH